MNKTAALALCGLLVACGAENDPSITPDPSGTGGSNTGGTGAEGGTGGEDTGGSDVGGNGAGGSGGGPGTPPIVVADVPCDINVGGILYAEADFPGESMESLARVAVLAHAAPAAQAGYPTGYEHVASTPFVATGKVSASCGTVANQSFDSISFILPQD